MAQPTLNAVTLEYPTNWSVAPIIGEAIAITLNGKIRSDVMYRRYKYNLQYDVLSKSDFETLENAINTFIDANTFPTFTYDKIAKASSGIAVKARLSAEERVAGAGMSYYVGVNLELEEVNNRI